MKLDKYDIALTNACAKEDSRPVLENVCYRNGELAAVDGFMMVVRQADTDPNENPPHTLLPVSILKTIKVNAKRIAELSINGKCEVVFKNENGEPVDFEPSISFKPFDRAEFPKYESLFPKEQEKTAVTAMSVGLLKRLVKCLPDDGILRFGIINTPGERKSDQPIEFECTNMDRPIRGMIMPMYTDWTNFKWHREEAKVEPNTVV